MESFFLYGLTHKPNRDLILILPKRDLTWFRSKPKQTLSNEEIFTQEEKGLLVNLQYYPLKNNFLT